MLGDAYTNRMIKSNSFEPIIDILVESSARNSLLNSAVLELLQFVLKVDLPRATTHYQENKKAVIIHIVEMYGERFKLIDTFGVVEQINRKYAQYHDTSGVTGNAVEPIDRYPRNSYPP